MPDDWGEYYVKCNICHTEYHLSEGECGCMTWALDEAADVFKECSCGYNDWAYDDTPESLDAYDVADVVSCSRCGCRAEVDDG